MDNKDDKNNEKKAEKFEATGTALFLYNPKSGSKKDLTDFAFMNANNKEKFISDTVLVRKKQNAERIIRKATELFKLLDKKDVPDELINN